MRFYRKTQGAVLGGVCSGIAEELRIDPLLVRLGALLLCFISAGLAGLIYLLLWTVLPAGDSNTTIKEEVMDKLNSVEFLKGKMQNPMILGGLLIGLGLVLFINYLLPIDRILQTLVPLLLIGVGAYLLFRFRK